jgi:hypothetical protein
VDEKIESRRKLALTLLVDHGANSGLTEYIL